MAYEYLFCNDSDPAIRFDERQRRRQAEARSICDIGKIDNPADCLVSIRCSGNALVALLNAMSAHIHEFARRDAEKWMSTSGQAYAPSSLKIYAIIDQLRDQLSEQRCSQREPLDMLR